VNDLDDIRIAADLHDGGESGHQDEEHGHDQIRDSHANNSLSGAARLEAAIAREDDRLCTVSYLL
jgi:hypothetical protein